MLTFSALLLVAQAGFSLPDSLAEGQVGKAPDYLELETPRPASWDYAIRGSLVGRALEGHVQVREHAIEGTRLGLERDLGYGFQLGGRGEFAADSSDLELTAQVEFLDGSASRTAPRDYFFNGSLYPAGESTRTLTHFLTVRMHAVFKNIFGAVSGGWTGPLIGIEYDYYLMNVTSSLNKHSSEDWTHYYPYPVIGWAGEALLTDGLGVTGRATVGYLPNVPSGFIEGGRLHVSVRPSVWVDMSLFWQASRSVRLSAGFNYQYWNGADHSVEDGNKLTFSAPGVSLSFEYSW